MDIKKRIAVASMGVMAVGGMVAPVVTSALPVASAVQPGDTSGATGVAHNPLNWFTGDVSNAFNLKNIYGVAPAGVTVDESAPIWFYQNYDDSWNAQNSGVTYATVADLLANVKFADLTPNSVIEYMTTDWEMHRMRFVDLDKPGMSSSGPTYIIDGAGGTATFTVADLTYSDSTDSCPPTYGATIHTPEIISGYTRNPDGSCTISYTPSTNGSWGSMVLRVRTPGSDPYSTAITTDVIILIKPAAVPTPTPKPTPTPTPTPNQPVTPKPTPVEPVLQYVTDTATFQYDTVVWKNSAWWGNRYLSMSKERYLRAAPAEGKALGIWAEMGKKRGSHLSEKAGFVTVSIKHVKGSTVTDAQWARAVDAKIGKKALVTNPVVTTKSMNGSKTVVWMLGKGASVKYPFGVKHTVDQRFIAHS